MSTQAKADFADHGPGEDAVHDYLEAHPDFFERHPTLLTSLRLPHATGGAVSLIERQMSVLRQKDLKLERQLKELLDVARANDVLVAKIHALTMRLLAAADLNTTVATIEEAMRSAFDADQAVLVIFGDPDAFGDVAARRFFHVVDRDDDGLKPFTTFLSGKSATRSGPSCSATTPRKSARLPSCPSGRAPRSAFWQSAASMPGVSIRG